MPIHFTYKHVGELEIELVSSAGADALTTRQVALLREHAETLRANYAGENNAIPTHNESPLKEFEILKTGSNTYNISTELEDAKAYSATITVALPKIYLSDVSSNPIVLGQHYAGGIFISAIIPFLVHMEVDSLTVMCGAAVV